MSFLRQRVIQLCNGRLKIFWEIKRTDSVSFHQDRVSAPGWERRRENADVLVSAGWTGDARIHASTRFSLGCCWLSPRRVTDDKPIDTSPKYLLINQTHETISRHLDNALNGLYPTTTTTKNHERSTPIGMWTSRIWNRARKRTGCLSQEDYNWICIEICDDPLFYSIILSFGK